MSTPEDITANVDELVAEQGSGSVAGFMLDSTTVKVYPNAVGSSKKKGFRA